MEAKDFRFYYPEQKQPAVAVKDWQVQKGTLQLLVGPSGCGKTTLLRQLMKQRGWQGREEGTLCNKAKQTSFVWQNPEGQIVTDRVEYEIVFGLENRGVSKELMRRRLAEIVTNFGLESLLKKDTMALSGGEKQILNVASAMAMEPELLLLDEPTSQLDPVAARHLFDLLKNICEEQGTTIVIAEQRLEEIIPVVDSLLLLENGKVIAQGTPGEIYPTIRNSRMEIFFPSYMKLLKNQVVLTKKEARLAIDEEYVGLPDVECLAEKPVAREVIEGKHLCVRFEKKGKDILEDCSFCIKKKRITCFVGGNGSGKTTLLRILYGKLRPYAGKIKGMPKTVSYLPQNPLYLMLQETVEKELGDVDEEQIRLFELEKNWKQNPHDLSGGELQRVGLCKVLSQDAECYLLDEPTKGLDGEMKAKLIKILSDIKEKGKTIVVVSHDMEFVARLADYVGMMFDGKMVVMDPVQQFMEGNQYYTTSIHRVAKQLNSHIIVEEDMNLYAKKK